MLRAVDLKTDTLVSPLGLETQRPRLSWRLEADRAGARQTAYRVRVTGDAGAELWDTGKVASDQCFDIAYAGAPLASRQRCAWTVEVWDERGEPGAASPTATWEMGLLAPGDWQAQWLAVETEEARADRAAGLRSIWSDDEPGASPRRFRRRVRLSEPAEAVLLVGARDRLTALSLDGAQLQLPAPNPAAFGREGVLQLALGELPAGEHVIAAEVSGAQHPRDPRPWRGAFTALLKLRTPDGRTERIVADGAWKTALGGGDGWAAWGFDDSAWADAVPATGAVAQTWPPTPAMYLRRGFAVGAAVVCARLYATALGAYEAFLNGMRVGDARLAPESTDYRRRLLYQVYDVTELVRAGENVLGAHVGDGWYASVVAPGGRYAFGPAPRRFLAQLELIFADGSREVVATGPGWRTSPSPVLSSEIYNGETRDARLEQPGWNAPGFDDADWTAAHPGDAPPARLVAQTAPPIRVTQTRRALRQEEQSWPPWAVQNGVLAVVMDFGQNLAGFVRLRAKGPRGAEIRLRFAEILQDDGQVDQKNLRAAKATDTFILAGTGDEEAFEPVFTYHGFRYVQAELHCDFGPGAFLVGGVEALVISSDLPITGALRIGHAGIEQLWRNTLWSQRSNFTGIPTDCPQRDERLGWLGDACVFWDAAAWNMDVYAFTQRFAGDMRDAQGASGGFSDYAPAARRAGDQPAPGWADAGVVLPWTAWRRYGSTAIIDDHWDAMARYLRYIEDANPDRLWANKRGLDFGDWLALDAKNPGDPTTPKDLIGTAWWAHTTALAGEMARATGREADAAWLGGLHADIVAAFQRAYVAPDGAIGNGSQTGYILALKFGLVPAALRAAAGQRLTDEIEGRGGVLSTGFLGTPFSLDVLADIGRPDLVYDLLLRTEFPSWGYMIAKGATTIWERWNGDTGDVAMNSFNHYALGAVSGFLFRRIPGIDAAAPGFREIRIAPVLDPQGRVRTAGADYDSVLGRISTDWSWDPGSRFDLDVTVPPNATARVVLPASLGRLADAAVVTSTDAGEIEVALGAGQTQLTLRP